MYFATGVPVYRQPRLQSRGVQPYGEPDPPGEQKGIASARALQGRVLTYCMAFTLTGDRRYRDAAVADAEGLTAFEVITGLAFYAFAEAGGTLITQPGWEQRGAPASDRVEWRRPFGPVERLNGQAGEWAQGGRIPRCRSE